MIDISSRYRSELSDDRYVDLVCVGLDCLMMDRSSLRGSGLDCLIMDLICVGLDCLMRH